MKQGSHPSSRFPAVASPEWHVVTDLDEDTPLASRSDTLFVKILDGSGATVVTGHAPRYHDDTPAAIVRRRNELRAAVLEGVANPRLRDPVPAAPLRPGPRGRIGVLIKRALYGGLLVLYRPPRDLFRTLLGRHPVRIFTWHRVTDLVRDGMTIDATRMAAQLDFIQRTHTVVSFREALESLASGSKRRRPMAVLTFDDAYRSVYTNAYPLLQARGLAATVFVPTDFPDSGEFFPHDDGCPVRPFCDVMSWAELAALAAAGWTIGGHTASHARLRQGNVDHSRAELERCLEALGSRGYGPDVPMAFCFGRPEDCPRDAAEAALAMGYSAVCTSLIGENNNVTPFDRLRRLDIGGDHPSYGWKAWVHGLVPNRHGRDA